MVGRTPILRKQFASFFRLDFGFIVRMDNNS